MWEALDPAWREAFRQAWEALRAGSIPVGACVATRDGDVVHASRNRMFERSGPPGEVYGSALAHAEINVLARVGARQHADLVLTTTLEPCLQCAAAVRLQPVGVVRFAGEDRYWEGCHDFSKLSEREASRPPVRRVGPMRDELGSFATLISRLGTPLSPAFERWLRETGEGPMLDLVARWSRPEELHDLKAMEVDEAFSHCFADLRTLGGRDG